MATTPQVVFSIVFKKGLAERNRLPLEHVITTLQHIQNMIREVGRQIQRDAGVEDADGDFGIELLGGRTGLAFRKGSLATSAAITRNIDHGILAVNTVIKTTDVLQKKQDKQPLNVTDYGEEVLRRLPRISEIQEQDQTELHLSLSKGRHVVTKSKLGEKGRETLRSLEGSEFTVEAVTLFGKLRELKDMARSEQSSGFFWGELLEDNGHYWRLRFSDADQRKVLSLFRRQVSVAGDATYFKTKTPRVIVKEIHDDPMPDYLTAFDRFSEEYADTFKDRETEEILDEIRE